MKPYHGREINKCPHGIIEVEVFNSFVTCVLVGRGVGAEGAELNRKIHKQLVYK